MSLYLCTFDGEREVAGFEVGRYSDFSALRRFVVRNLEGGRPGSRFPTFILRSDCDAEWSARECPSLILELRAIRRELQALAPCPFGASWQETLSRAAGRTPANAHESFIDVDGAPVVERLCQLAEEARQAGLPILFQ